jgi:hypothetical protein
MLLRATHESLSYRLPSQISSAIDQLREVGRTDKPRRLLAAEAEYPARQQLRWSSAACFLEAQTEILWSNLRQENIGLSKFSQ